MIRFVLAIPALALSDALRVGSNIALAAGHTIAGGNVSPLNR